MAFVLMAECFSHVKANMLFTPVATNYFEERGFDYRRSISLVIFWFPDSVMREQLE